MDRLIWAKRLVSSKIANICERIVVIIPSACVSAPAPAQPQRGKRKGQPPSAQRAKNRRFFTPSGV